MTDVNPLPRTCLIALLLAGVLSAVRPCFAVGGELELNVVDDGTGQPMAVRMYLKDQRGRIRKPPRVPFWKDHFVFAGQIVLELPEGRYTFELGPEQRPEPMVAEIGEHGGMLESVTPLRATLEDVFVERVS